jgi:hypothetical protein
MLAVTSNRRSLRKNSVSSQSASVVSTASVPISVILFILMIEAITSFQKLVFTRGTRRNIPKYVALYI